jgi:hypothetical protein
MEYSFDRTDAEINQILGLENIMSRAGNKPLPRQINSKKPLDIINSAFLPLSAV